MNSVVITGANVGIGLSAARAIAVDPNWHVVLGCRNPLKARSAGLDIQSRAPRAHVSALPLDLDSLASVRRFVDQLDAERVPPLGGLILNAGGINMKARAPELSLDGFERTFQLNFLGHFVLVQLLLPLLVRTSRVIFVVSDLHDPAATKMGKLLPPRFGPVQDLAFARETAAGLHPMARYATAKLYTVMCGYELDRRLRAAGSQITVNSWSPGVVPTTQAGRDMHPLMKRIMTSRRFVRFMGSHLSTEEDAGRALYDLLTSDRYAEVTGQYFDGFEHVPSSVESCDEVKARAVWEQALQLVNGITGAGLETAGRGAEASHVDQAQGRV